ncbi:hypothetical protein ACHQM5_007197 [Ranunculus cassubicifolius]
MADFEAINTRFEKLDDTISSISEQISKRIDEVIALLNRKSDPVKQQSYIPFAQPDTLRVQPNPPPPPPVLHINSPIQITPSFHSTIRLNKPESEEVQVLAEEKGQESVKDKIELEDELVLNLEEEDPKMAELALMNSQDNLMSREFASDSVGKGRYSVENEILFCSCYLRMVETICTHNIRSLSSASINIMVLKYGHRGHAREVFDEMADKVGCCSFKVCARMLRYGKLGHPQQVFDQMLASTTCYTLQNMNGVVDYWCVFLNSLLINYGKMACSAH